MLTVCAINDNHEAMEILIENADKSDEEKLRDWANMKTNKGFTALHFASYFGNIEIVELLMYKLDADYKIKNNVGLNVLHFAA